MQEGEKMSEINFADAIEDITKQYSEEVSRAVDRTGRALAKYGAKKLRVTSPKKTGRYAKSWGYVKSGGKYVVRAKLYQLTHLLENGHANRDGGRTGGIPHIKPVEDEIGLQAEPEFKKQLKG